MYVRINNMSNIRVRIAPSPTGEDLHIGNVYTALLNFVFARQNKGTFLVRIEDTDRQRLVKGAEEKIFASLKWLGLNYDEGSDIGGKFGPYRQSERLEFYRHYAEELVKRGNAYYCVCTKDILDQMRRKQKEKGQPTLYDGRCLKKNYSKGSLMGKKYVIRLKVPDSGTTEFNDLIRGKISFDNKLIDDQVLLKSDGFPTYHLAVVVDDHLMKISHIIRAEDWISSTPKHILLYKYFGWEQPVFVHGPLLRNPDRSKLSKRKNPVWVSWYRQQGFLPEAILNYLALMGWSHPDEKEIFSIDEMIKHFRLEDIKTVGPSFDIRKLEWMNGEYIRKLKMQNLKIKIVEFIGKKYPQDIVEKTVPLIQERIKKLSDYMPLCEFFFQKPKTYEIDLKNYSGVIRKIKECLSQVMKWRAKLIGQTMQDLAQELKMKNSEFFMTLRIAVTGKKISPPLNESMEILGKQEVLVRLSNISHSER